MVIPDPDLDFFTYPGSRVQNAQGRGSATLFLYFLVSVCYFGKGHYVASLIYFFYNRIRPLVSFRFRILDCTGIELGYESKRRKRKNK
jgi:hypothetical protein